MVDIAGNSSTTESITVGGTLTNTLETSGDHDWVRIELTAGQSIVIALSGSGATPLADPFVRVRDSAGNEITSNDDGGAGLGSMLRFTATTSGTYYIDVGAYSTETGDYQLSVETVRTWSNDEVAEYLVDGAYGSDGYHFNAAPGGTITVNLTALTAEGQFLAREALALWSDVTGISFSEVATGGQITFDDNESGAFCSTTWSGGYLTGAHVNVSTQWLADYGTGISSYSMHTYLHEVGHALGLGHGGDYNLTGDYSSALYLNDGWPTSIMSYFNQSENSYFAGQGFTYNLVLTPMAADILAMSLLYGTSTTTRTGDTIYGFNSNAGRAVFDAALHPNVGYTIFDSGGTDTLDYSGTSHNQLINLNPETFSNVLGHRGNVSIGRGVVIENAISGSGNDTIIGNAANNVLNGGGGEDTVSYEAAEAGVTVDLRSTTQQNTGGAGRDTLAGFERLIGSAFGDVLIGGAATMSITGGAGNDRIIAGAASAPGGLGMYGGDGDDVFVLGAAADWVDGGEGFDTIDCSTATGPVLLTTSGSIGSSPDTTISIEKIIGSDYDDHLAAWNAGDVLLGGAGSDTLESSPWGTSQLIGGSGNDSYVIRHAATQITENAGEGVDSVRSHYSFTLAANVENLTLTGTGAINGTGNALPNEITGNDSDNLLDGAGGDDRIFGNGGNDTLIGGAGGDSMRGGAGDDIYEVDNSGDVVTELAGEGVDTVRSQISFALTANVENLILTGTAAINGTGNALANVLNGNLAANILNGGAGADTMYGSAGNDTYVVDNISDRVGEAAGGGTDLVEASVSYALASNVENLTLTGTAAINGTGNALDNVLNGNSAANVLNGGASADTMNGGLGNDTYVVDDGGDLIGEAADGGTDIVYTSVSYALAANVEHLRLTGTASINATGNSLANALTGNNGANVINGGAGADNMYGGLGNDTYVVDNIYDRIGEIAAGGIDLVQASVSYALGSNLENLTLTGTAAINGFGNALNNVLTGNSAANVLNGGVGADTTVGEGGNDTYVVDNVDDRVVEEVDGGIELVYSSVSYALAANVEHLRLTGTANINATGNSLANALTGNNGANVINGGGGADNMYGGLGNDTYVVDNIYDRIGEIAAGGVDTVHSSVSYGLGSNLEHLVLTGTANISATGNGLDNTLTGNAGSNGLAGGLGNDSLSGGAGADRFIFNTSLDEATNVDRIIDFSVADDTIVLDDDVFTAIGATGTLAASAFRTGTEAQDADDRIIYDSATGRIYYDADGSGAGAQVLFAQVAAGLALTNADFLIGG